MEKMRKLYMCVYISSSSLSIISIFTAIIATVLLFFFCFFILPFPIISIIANYVLADEGYNSGRTTSANRNNNFLKDLLALNHG